MFKCSRRCNPEPKALRINSITQFLPKAYKYLCNAHLSDVQVIIISKKKRRIYHGNINKSKPDKSEHY